MTISDKYFTIVFKDLTQAERVALSDAHPDKISASSYSHVMDDRDQLLGVLSYAECALGDIGDADREPGDDLEWCERRAAEALPRIRELLLAHGKTTTAMTTTTPTTAMTTTTRDDVHSSTARLLFNRGAVTPQESRLAKKINYGVIYGMIDTDIRLLLGEFPNG